MSDQASQDLEKTIQDGRWLPWYARVLFGIKRSTYIVFAFFGFLLNSENMATWIIAVLFAIAADVVYRLYAFDAPARDMVRLKGLFQLQAGGKGASIWSGISEVTTSNKTLETVIFLILCLSPYLAYWWGVHSYIVAYLFWGAILILPVMLTFRPLRPLPLISKLTGLSDIITRRFPAALFLLLSTLMVAILLIAAAGIPSMEQHPNISFMIFIQFIYTGTFLAMSRAGNALRMGILANYVARHAQHAEAYLKAKDLQISHHEQQEERWQRDAFPKAEVRAPSKASLKAPPSENRVAKRSFGRRSNAIALSEENNEKPDLEAEELTVMTDNSKTINVPFFTRLLLKLRDVEYLLLLLPLIFVSVGEQLIILFVIGFAAFVGYVGRELFYGRAITDEHVLSAVESKQLIGQPISFSILFSSKPIFQILFLAPLSIMSLLIFLQDFNPVWQVPLFLCLGIHISLFSRVSPLAPALYKYALTREPDDDPIRNLQGWNSKKNQPIKSLDDMMKHSPLNLGRYGLLMIIYILMFLDVMIVTMIMPVLEPLSLAFVVLGLTHTIIWIVGSFTLEHCWLSLRCNYAAEQIMNNGIKEERERVMPSPKVF